MTDIDEICTVTDLTRDHWLYVYRQVVTEGSRDRNLIAMGGRLIGLGLATEDEIKQWRKSLMHGRIDVACSRR